MSKTIGSRISKLILTIIIALLVLLLLAEFGLRWTVSKQLKDAVGSNSTGQEASISFGPTPLLFSAVTRNVPHVTIDSPSTVSIKHPGDANAVPEVTGTPQSFINVDSLNIADPDNPVAGSLSLRTTLTDDYLLAVLQKSIAENQTRQPAPAEGTGNDLGALAGAFLQQLIQVTGITSNPTDGTVKVDITGGAANLTLKPEAIDGRLSFTATNASLLGVELPSTVSDALTKGLRDQASAMAGNLMIKSVEVVDHGVKIEVVGDNINLNELGKEKTSSP
ncbi:DUF2993 domain-containing protein [Corynebacterium silvaticum]|nr:DUF2993 domain-containing protein [Corynebacterium silvaticum]MBH5299998.1 LmeA family phospholipid-binding protein [Corynebacterium silvaticum]NOM65477.1 DUF2993 domain-containing protein [Corynebacterium silvaticum]TFA92324.1 DUF2993 domain-containing protein [Corynebacterium silvaticum]TFA96203.1 DUF2993 domain-containing protein [Corynebacterium silvaticum]TNX79595.1 DUF2993 domain-containing protein [Corynebacterium silvaticum]